MRTLPSLFSPRCLVSLAPWAGGSLLALLALMMLAGCTTMTPTATTIEAGEREATFNVTPDVRLPLPSAVCSVGETSATLLTFDYVGKTHPLIALTRCSAGKEGAGSRLTMWGLTTTGMRLFTIDWEGTRVVAQSHLPPQVAKTIAGLPDPHQVLGDYALAHLALSEWAPYLAKAVGAKGPLTLTDDEAGTRTLRDAAGNVVETIAYTNTDTNTATITNRREASKRLPERLEQRIFHYRITFEALPMDDFTIPTND